MGFGLLMREAGVCRFPQDAPDQPGALTTFEDIATRQEPEVEEQPGLHSTVRQRSATTPSLSFGIKGSFSKYRQRAEHAYHCFHIVKLPSIRIL